MIQVPEQFRQSAFRYPIDNVLCFEEWFFYNYDSVKDYRDDRVYLPIFWTGYYVRNNISPIQVQEAGDRPSIKKLRDYLYSLNPNIKYYTIVQHDDGIMHDISHLDIEVYSMGSHNQATKYLPLSCMPHAYSFNHTRTLKASFAGRITHDIRQRMFECVAREQGYYLSMLNRNMQQFCEILSRSTFALAPRGYGPTSFRIAEAIQYGAIPVYISDDFVQPYGMAWDELGIIHIPEEEIDLIPDILNSVHTPAWQRRVKDAKHLYSYEYMKKYIITDC